MFNTIFLNEIFKFNIFINSSSTKLSPTSARTYGTQHRKWNHPETGPGDLSKANPVLDWYALLEVILDKNDSAT